MSTESAFSICAWACSSGGIVDSAMAYSARDWASGISPVAPRRKRASKILSASSRLLTRAPCDVELRIDGAQRDVGAGHGRHQREHGEAPAFFAGEQIRAARFGEAPQSTEHVELPGRERIDAHAVRGVGGRSAPGANGGFGADLRETVRSA